MNWIMRHLKISQIARHENLEHSQ